MSNPAPALTLSEAERPVLEALSKSQVAAHREVQRAQVLLMAADGFANEMTVVRATEHVEQSLRHFPIALAIRTSKFDRYEHRYALYIPLRQPAFS